MEETDETSSSQISEVLLLHPCLLRVEEKNKRGATPGSHSGIQTSAMMFIYPHPEQKLEN